MACGTAPTPARNGYGFSAILPVKNRPALVPNTGHGPKHQTDKETQYSRPVWGKSERVFNFHRATFEALAELVGAAGLDRPAQFGPAHFSRRVSANEVRGVIELYPAQEPGELGAVAADKFFEIPWAMASPRQFRAMPLAA